MTTSSLPVINALLDLLLAALQQEFRIRHHSPSKFVGFTITRDRPHRTLYLSQPDYIQKIIRQFRMESCHPHIVPSHPNASLSRSSRTREEPMATTVAATAGVFPYRDAIGSLLYLSLMTRPDISFAVGLAARYVQEHDTSHVNAVKRIISYLKGTSSYGIRFDGSSSGPVIGYTDADYGGCLDTRRSTTGTVFLHNWGPIAWCSRRQDCTATSTAEAEYIAAAETAKEAVWIRRMRAVFHPEQQNFIRILCDNKSVIELTKHTDQRKRSKHISIRYHYIREQQQNGTEVCSYKRSVRGFIY